MAVSHNLGEGMVCLLAGAYFIVIGATSKTIINEVEIVATKEERQQARATPMKRLICIALGLACVIYGIAKISL